MRFTLLDRIDEISPGERIVAVKQLSLAEEYLADHFPRFPVMPGVLMIEALTQTAAWLIRVTDDFSHSLVTLQQARQVRFASFLEPGKCMRLEVDIKDRDARTTRVSCSGSVDDQTIVSARLTLEHRNLAETDPGKSSVDRVVIAKMRELYALLRPAPAVAKG